MSLFSTFILPLLKKEAISLEPKVAEFIIIQLHKIAIEVIEWIETKTHIDLDCDGVIGHIDDNEAVQDDKEPTEE